MQGCQPNACGFPMTARPPEVAVARGRLVCWRWQPVLALVF